MIIELAAQGENRHHPIPRVNLSMQEDFFSYGRELSRSLPPFRQALIDKIFKGANPGDLPVGGAHQIGAGAQPQDR